MAFKLFANHYVLEVESGAIAGPERWRNTIDIAATAGPPAPGDAIITAFVDMIQDTQQTTSEITSSNLRNWSHGDVPFSQQAHLWEQVYSGKTGNQGAWAVGYTPGPPCLGEVCAVLRKTPFASGGKPGRLFLRNVYQRDNIAAVAGGPPVFDASFNETVFSAALNARIASDLSGFLTDNNPRFVIIHFSVKEWKLDNTVNPTDDAIDSLTFQDLTMHNLSRKSPK